MVEQENITRRFKEIKMNEIEEYEQRTGIKLDSHQREVLRSMTARENKWWDEEEGRVLNDSNRYPE